MPRSVTSTYCHISYCVAFAQHDQLRRSPTETTRFISVTTTPEAGAGSIPGYTFTITDPENVLSTSYLQCIIREHVGCGDITPHLTIKRSKTYTEEPGPADFHIFVPASLFSGDSTVTDFCWELTHALPESLLA